MRLILDGAVDNVRLAFVANHYCLGAKLGVVLSRLTTSISVALANNKYYSCEKDKRHLFY